MSENILDYIDRYDLYPDKLFSHKVGGDAIYIFRQKTTERVCCLNFSKEKFEGATISNLGIRSILVDYEWIIYGRLQEGEKLNTTPQMGSQTTIVNGVFFIVASEYEQVELELKYGYDTNRNISLKRPQRDPN